MRFKGTLALLLAFVALGGYVYFVDYRGREERQKQEAAKKKVFPIEAENVAELTLEFPDRTVSAVRKGEAEWAMTAPAGMEADAEAWESLASNLASVEKEEPIVAEKAPDLAQYGLDKPFVKVTAKLQNGDTIGILFGSENPRKTFRYARQTNQEDVFLSATSWSSGFDKTLYDLRNKDVLHFETESVDMVRIAASGRPEIELQKSGADWLLKKPVEAMADSSEVSSFISSIQFARATEFADAGMDARKAGLEPPDTRITIHDQGGQDHVLLLGKSIDTEKHYAKDQSRPSILIVGKDIPEKVRRPLFDWRDKTIVRFSRDSIDEVEVTRGSERMIFKKVGTEWQFADGKKAKQDRIVDWLSSLEFDRASAILDAPKSPAGYGVEPGRVRAVLREGGKDVAAISFGSEVRPDGVYAKVSSDPAILTVPRTLYDKFNVGPGEMAETAPEVLDPAK